MNPDRYRRAGEIYHAALALPPDRRAPFLERSCAGDLDLLGEVESLMEAHANAGPFIEGTHPHVGTLLDAADEPSTGSSDRSTDEAPFEAVESALAPGQRLGRYEVLDLLGTGGMGSVYRAIDSSLGREVAIKALAHTFRGDAPSLRRFEREARVLATLSHPNIASIYGFERLDGEPYLVLERVDGETLADRLTRGAMSVDVVRALGEQIVAGLEEAHGKGIVHRDLKPSNVMVTPDGRVKLVDFGLAKTTGPRPALEPSAETITSPGVVLGTARYMSPEQLRGDLVDTRTDVWAFGCVLYEMLTARPAFAARSAPEVVAAILRDDPAWDVLPSDTSPNVGRLLRRCLRRDPRMRLQHIGDARLELMEAEEAAQAPPVPPVGRITMRRTWLWSIGAALIALAAAFLLTRLPSPAVRPAAVRASLELPGKVALATDFSPPFAIAPTGSPVVFVAAEGTTDRLYVRELTSPALRALAGTEGARQPFFSPDGAWVGFFANRKLSKIPVAGGPVLHLADVGDNARGAAWVPDGTIVFAAPQTVGLTRVPESGGRAAPLTTLDTARGESSHRWPDVLPGGKWVLFTVGLQDASFDEARIEAVSLETGERRLLVSGAGYARYVPDGRLLFVRGGRVHQVGFDPERVAVRGRPDVVLDPVRYDFRNGGSHLTASASGVILYGPGEPISSEYFLTWIDRHGQFTRVSDTGRPFRYVRASPDGERVAAVIGTSTDSDLWLVDPNGTLSRLSFGLSPHRPTWTSSGDAVSIGAESNGTWRILTIAAHGKGEPTTLIESAHRVYPNAWSHDGRYLLFQERRPESGWDLQVLDVAASGRPVGAPRAFANTPFDETSAAMSLDGRWIAYESNEVDGVVQVYVRSFPDGAHKVRASPRGGRSPAWDAHGNLYYWQTEDDTMWAVPTSEKGGRLLIGAPYAVWRGTIASAVLRRIVNPVAGARYDLERTGTRFLVLERAPAGAGSELSHPMVVLGGPIR